MPEEKLAIKFHLLNIDVGGQTESVIALCRTLRNKGLQIQLPLHDLINIEDKAQVESYQQRYGMPSRLRHFVTDIRSADKSCVQHVMLPSPGWSWLVWGISELMRDRKLIFQFGGYSIGFKESYGQVLRWAWEDPQYYLVRLAMNNSIVAQLIPKSRVRYIVSTWMQAEELRTYHVDPAVINVIPNMVATLTRINKVEARKALDLPEDRFIFGFAGALTHVKGIDVLLRSYEIVSQRKTALHSHLAIAGKRRDPVIGQIDLMRLGKSFNRIPFSTSNVSLLGIVDIILFLSAVDVLVLPYRTLLSTNLQPSLVLEALSVGTPVLTTPVFPLDELLEEGIKLWLCKPADPLDLASKMEETADNFDEVKKQSEQNVHVLRNTYFEDVSEKYIRCYEHVLEQ